MDYANCIGRVAALAVALGVGAAVATMPAVGYATPDTSGSSNTDSSSTTGESSSTGAAASPTGSNSPSATGDSPSAPISDGSPTATVSNSGGAHTSDDDGIDSEGDGAVIGDADDTTEQSLTAGADEGDEEAVPPDAPAPPDPVTVPALDDLPAPTAPTAPAPGHSRPNAPSPPADRGPASGDSAPTDPADDAAATTLPESDEPAPSPPQADVTGPPAAGIPDAPQPGPAAAATALTPADVNSPAATPEPGVPWPVSALTDVADTVIKVASDLVTAAFGPLLGDTSSPLLWAVLAWTRREIGDIGRAVSTVIPGTTNLMAAVQTIDLPDPSSLLGWIPGYDAVAHFVSTYVDLTPWLTGRLWLPTVLWPIFFNNTPVAAPMLIELDLAQGVTSGAIPFTASDPDGNLIVYSVPDKGMPGGPKYGTVVVDNVAGTFTYTPDENYIGTDSFAFVVSDDTNIHVHAWEQLLNAAFGLFNTSFVGGHTTTATVTVFNGMAIATDPDLPEYNSIIGDFDFLTYNIAGLPFPFSGGAWPRIPSISEIGMRINSFDVVNVQEDVAFHPFLVANAAFPDQTQPQLPSFLWPFSDGLNTFSAYRIESLTRQAWGRCDAICVAPKGFTYKRLHIPGGESIDVYNVHLNEGGGSLTNADLEQLTSFIKQWSVGRAVIVTGDFNAMYSEDGQALTQFAMDNELIDAWVEVEYNGTIPTDAPTCAYQDSCEQQDKIFYRSAAPLVQGDISTSPVILEAIEYTNEGLNFLNGSGQDLSASRPQSVTFQYTTVAVGPLNVDLENWMAKMPGIQDLPLTQLPIPGTHDSGTYSITSSSPWALTGADNFGPLTQFPQILQDLIIKPIAAAWAITQSRDLYEQFTDGIRYVDLRLTHEPDGKIYVEHGLRGAQVDELIIDIAAFANTHPKEVMIVYMQQFTNFDDETHDRFIQQLRDAFGPRMVPRAVGTSATLNDLWDMDKNVIVVYNDFDYIDPTHPDLWPDDTLFRPWPNVPSMEELYPANVENQQNRPPDSIWGLFGEPTQNAFVILMGLLTLGPTTQEHFITRTHPTLQQWLRVDFKSALNLVTEDWYQEIWPLGSSFSRDVISAAYETMSSRVA